MTYPMTGPGIAGFQAKATGPSVLVSGLRSMTRVLSVFFKEVSHMDSLQAKIPPGVLDGGLSGLLSKRLQGTIKDFEPVKSEVEIKSNESKPFPLAQEENEKAAALPGPFQQAVQGHQESTSGITGSDSHSLPSRETSTGGEEQEGKTPGYIFVEKLNEYFHLNRQEPSPEPGTAPFPAVDRRWRNGNEGKAPSFSNAAAETRRPGPGFKMSEEQVARELRAFIDGRGNFSPAERSSQVYSTNGTGDLRIQNTFNINLDHDGTRENGSLGSLTEKIADILREQALQHGIDIT